MRANTQRTAERERLVNAAHRLAQLSQGDALKLFRLLYMLDVQHFRSAGRSCTGETYYALADGPAPGTLRPALIMRDLDLDTAIDVLTATQPRESWSFDPRYFNSRDLSILNEIENHCGGVPACQLRVEDANAWWRVYNTRGGVGAVIPYEMTLHSPGCGSVLEKSSEWLPFLGRLRIAESTRLDHRVD